VALDVIRLVESLPRKHVADVIGRQLLRSATSIGANYRAACRGKSRADVLAKLAIVEEEADETIYWVELLVESGILHPSSVSGLLKEVNEIIAMTVASIKTLRERNDQLQTNRDRKFNPKSKSPVSSIQNPKSKI
jgi:four helix bundle protein